MTGHRVVGTGAAEAAPRVGVVGGGQLARMMQEAAIPLGIDLRALVEAADGSAGQAVPHSRVGQASDVGAVEDLARQVDVLTVEHEHVPDAVLRAAERIVPVRPGAHALAFAQDKLGMRRRMDELGVPCPRWRRVEDAAQCAAAVREFGGQAVLKTPRDGYDGKGVAVVDLDGRGRLRGAGGFQSGFADAPDGLLLEERVGFSSGIAQLVARRPSGQIASWCAVETIQRRGVCLETVAPATVEPAVADEARRIAERVAESLDVVGVLAVEMFVAEDRVLVNELAMRPHNSGHWTIDGAVTSQFEQHLRAVLDLPLGSTAPVVPRTVMVNVLTSRLPDPRRAYPEAMAAYPDVKFHAYGKAVAPLRKIGHVTAGGDDVEEVRARAEAAAAILSGEGGG